MADEADIANDRAAIAAQAAVDQVRRKAPLNPGVPGECDKCGEQSARLIGGACAPCRDKFRLP